MSYNGRESKERVFCTVILQFKLRLVASDNLNENYTTVVIHIKDVNDNPPAFDRPTYETQITEEDDRHVPKRILQVIAIHSSGHVFVSLYSLFALIIDIEFKFNLIIIFINI